MLHVSGSRATNGRGRWLAFGATLVVSAAMLYAQSTETRCCDRKPVAAAPNKTKTIVKPAMKNSEFSITVVRTPLFCSPSRSSSMLAPDISDT